MPELNEAVEGGVADTIFATIQELRGDGPLVDQLLGGDESLIFRGMPQDAGDQPVSMPVEVVAEGGSWNGGYSTERHVVQVNIVAESDWYGDSGYGMYDALDRASTVLRDGLGAGRYPDGLAGGSTPDKMEDGRYVAMRRYRIRRHV